MKQRFKQDVIDKVIEQWVRERPDLNVTPMEIIGRITRVDRLIDVQMKAVCAAINLERWWFDVLAALRRSGKPYELTPTQLYNELMLTSGAMTNRIDRLEVAGLVERLHCPNDRRGVLVALTKEGLKLIDEALTTQMEVEEAMLGPFSPSDRETFVRLLRSLMQSCQRIA